MLDLTTIILYLIVGLTAGTISGLAGIGGGIILVPAFIYIFGLSQHQAQGTTLALMIPPIGLLAAYTYYKQGFVDLKMAAFVATGFFFGGLIGAKIAISIPKNTLRKIFGIIMLITAIYTIFKGE